MIMPDIESVSDKYALQKKSCASAIMAVSVGIILLLVAGTACFYLIVSRATVAPVDKLAEALSTIMGTEVTVRGSTAVLEKSEIDELEVLYEFYREEEVTEDELDVQYDKTLAAIDDLEFRSTLNKEEDELSCLLEINAGAGGTESCDWSEMLLRMYIMWAEKSGYKVKQLNRVDGDVAGVRSVEIEIKGDFVYGLLKGENGVHRLVRVSPFNSQGKRMTSFASVFVHPLIDDSIEIDDGKSGVDDI